MDDADQDNERHLQVQWQTSWRPGVGRSTKGGHVALNRFKARARHLFNWAVAQGYRDDTPFKRHCVNVVRLDGKAETVRERRLQPGEEELPHRCHTSASRGPLAHATPTRKWLMELKMKW